MSAVVSEMQHVDTAVMMFASYEKYITWQQFYSRETRNTSRLIIVGVCSAVTGVFRRSRRFVPLFVYSRKPFQIAEWNYFLLRKYGRSVRAHKQPN